MPSPVFYAKHEMKMISTRAENRVASLGLLLWLWSSARLWRRRRKEWCSSIVFRPTSRRLGHHSHRTLWLGSLCLWLQGLEVQLGWPISVSVSIAATWDGAVAPRSKGIMLSVWKLIGGVGVILSICCIPACTTKTNDGHLWFCDLQPEWLIFRSLAQEDRPLQLSLQLVALLRREKTPRLGLEQVPVCTPVIMFSLSHTLCSLESLKSKTAYQHWFVW